MLITNSLGRGELFVFKQSDLTTILSDAAIDGCQDFFSGKLVFTETETAVDSFQKITSTSLSSIIYLLYILTMPTAYFN
jgi:hypothetical protein